MSSDSIYSNSFATVASFLEEKQPSCKQYNEGIHSIDYELKYFYPNEGDHYYNLIPKTPSIEIHSSIVDYISHVKKYSFDPFYVAKLPWVSVSCMNDVGSIVVESQNNYVFSDISTRYNFSEIDFTTTKIFGNSVLLALDSGSNYFHWIAQILPRIHLLNKYNIDWSMIDHIIIPEIRGEFVKETLNLLNVPLDKLVETKKGTQFSCENLIIPCKPNRHIHITQWTLNFLNSLFLDNASSLSLSFPKKILILRKSNYGRNFDDQDKLQSFLLNKGYHTFFLEEMTFLEQAFLFHNATHIFSAHGASLTNLLFCTPDTKVFECFNSSHFHSLYWNISSLKELDYYYIQGKDSQSNAQHIKNNSINLNWADLSRLPL